MIQPAHLRLRQLRSASPQRGPAVAALHELVAEAERSSGCARKSEMRRMPSRSASASFIPSAYVSLKPSDALIPRPSAASASRSAASSCSPRRRTAPGAGCRCTRGRRPARRARRASQSTVVPPSSRRCTARAPALRASRVTISPRMTDSVNFLEPTRTSGRVSAAAREHRPKPAAPARSRAGPHAPRSGSQPLRLDEAGDERIRGMRLQLGQRALLHHASLAHQHHVLPEEGRLREIMGDQHHRLAQPLEDGAQVHLQLGADHRVQRAQRLVEQQHRPAPASARA